MKPVGRFSNLVAGSVALLSVLLICSAHAATGRAIVRNVRGTASYAEQGGEWKPLKSGQALSPGVTVKSGIDGGVGLNIGGNGPDVILLDSTTLAIDRLNVEQAGGESVIETSLNLTSGTIKGVVKKLSGASKYEVKTPNAVYGIRPASETKYQISANGLAQVIEGSIVVVYINPANQQMSTHTVNTGQTFVPPVSPGQGAPTVRETRPGEVVPDPFTTGPKGPTLVIVPQPEPFVSPIRTSGGSSASTPAAAPTGGQE